MRKIYLFIKILFASSQKFYLRTKSNYKKWIGVTTKNKLGHYF